MINHIFKIAIRFLLRERVSSLVSILGFSATLTAVFVITIFANRELGYDKFHKDSDNIYRITIKSSFPDGRTAESGAVIANVCEVVKKTVPGIEACTRIWPEYDECIIKRDEVLFSESSIAYVDPDFFKVFSFPFT